MFIAFSFLLFLGLLLVLFLIHAVVLFVSIKLFRVPNPSFKNALRILFVFDLLMIFGIAILIAFELGSLVPLILLISTLLFLTLLRKYHQAGWLKSFGIFGVFLVFSFLSTIVFQIIFVPAIRNYIAEPFIVSGVAMAPTYVENDYLLVKKFGNSYSRGDIVVYKYPKDPKVFFVGRIIGLPLESIEIRNGKAFINDQAVEESYITDDSETNFETVLASDEYFILGDNRLYSFDSREFGAIKYANIRGVVAAKILNWRRD